MENRPKIRPRPELLQPADLEVIDDIVSDLVEEELSVGDFMLAIAVRRFRYGDGVPWDRLTGGGVTRRRDPGSTNLIF
jgi:hypothetical protein